MPPQHALQYTLPKNCLTQKYRNTLLPYDNMYHSFIKCCENLKSVHEKILKEGVALPAYYVHHTIIITYLQT